MGTPPEKRRYSIEQYILLLQNTEQRLEYDHGTIYAMAGSSANHASISANMWDTPSYDGLRIWAVPMAENFTLLKT